MKVERLSYVIWAKDVNRGEAFYREVFDAVVVRRSAVMVHLEIAGSMISIHDGGEEPRTWTGLSFQVADLAAACAELRAGGGRVLQDAEDTAEEPAHLAMCMDTEGNEIMLTVAR